MLKTRVLTVLLLLPLFLAALFYLPIGGWIAFNLLVAGAAAWEWAQLGQMQRPAAAVFVAAALLVCVALIPFLDFLEPQHIGGLNQTVYALALIFWVAVVPFWLAYKWRTGKSAFAACGLVVLASTWLSLVQLREITPLLILWLFSVVWVADSAAFFCGKKFGKRKLAPAISPGKTWEGVWGATFAVTLYALAIAALNGNHSIDVFDTRLPAWVLLPAHWAIMVLSIVGDLFESLLKRQAGVKDSGNLLPGHGGVLDRIDGLTSSLPVMAFFIFTIFNK
jgi:phosphatidate cytidylyltransferase